MPAVHTNLRVEQGTSWSHGWLPILNGAPFLTADWAIKAQVRAAYGSEPVLYEWSSVIGNAEVVDQAVVMSVDPDESSAWTWVKGIYDVEVTSDGITHRLAEGEIRVIPEVTR